MNESNDAVTQRRKLNPSDANQPPCAVLKLSEQAERKIVCEVCGHVNKGDSLICEMCSNYLFD